MSTGRPAHGVTVELAGIPGAGKSRRTRALIADLRERGVAVTDAQAPLGPSVPTARRLSRKALTCAQAAWDEPARTARIVRGFLASAQPGAADTAGRLTQWLVAQRLAEQGSRRAGVSVLDEGSVQALWSTGLRGDVDPVLAALDATGWQPPARVLVVVRIPPEVAQARLTARASRHSRTQSLTGAEQLAELVQGAALLDRLIEWWRAASADRNGVLVVSGEHDHLGSGQLTDLVQEALASS